MDLTRDAHTGHEWIALSDEEIRIGFLSQCIETVAESLGSDYISAFRRLEDADMTKNYILKFYDTLHTESMENVSSILLGVLKRRESEKSA